MNLEIANRLLALRREHGYSQEELAYKLGVSRQAVSKWERAESSPDTDNLLALARLYGVSLDALLLHTPAEEAAQAAPEPDEAPADEDAEIFAAARAWDAAEEAEQKARKRARAKWEGGAAVAAHPGADGDSAQPDLLAWHLGGLCRGGHGGL